jgi:Thrombospondin type 3 repeat
MKAKCTRVLEVQGAADEDQDGDVTALDNCFGAANPGQHDQDADFEGDSCDSDPDGDGRVLAEDNCPFTSNDAQADSDGNGAGDACVPGLEPPFEPLESGSNHEYLYFVPSQDNSNNALRRGDTLGFHDGQYVGAFEQGNSLFSAYDKESDSYPIYTFRTFANLGAVSDPQLSLSDKGLSVESYDPDTGEKVSQQLAAFPELEFGVDVLVLVLDNDGLFKAIAVDLLPDGSMSAEVIWQTTPSGRHIRPATPLDRQDPLYRYVLHEADPVVTPPQQFFSEADGTELVGGDLPASEWEEISDLIQFFVLDGKSDKLVTVVESLCPGLLDGSPVDLPSCPLAQEYTQLISVESAVADYVRKGLIGGQLAIPNLACLSRDGSMQSCAVPPDYSPAYDDAGLPGSLLASPAGEHSPVVASLLGSRPDVGVVGQVTCENGLCPPALPGWGPALQHGAFYFITYDETLDDFSYWAVPLNDRACLRDSAASDDDKCPIVTHFGEGDGLFDIAAIAPALEPTGSSELVLFNKCRKILDIEAVLGSPLSDDDLALQDSTFLKWECSLRPDGLAALATAQADRIYLFLNRVVLEIMQLEAMALVMGTVPSALTVIGWEAATVEQGAALFFGAQGLTSVASHAVEMLEICPSIDQLLGGQVDLVTLGDCTIASMHVLFDAEMVAGAYRASLSLEEKLSPARRVFAREFDLKSSVAGGVAEESMSELVREVGEVKDIDATRRSGICVQ